MARAKKVNPIKGEFQNQIDAVTKETANDLYVKLNESEELSATAKQELNIALQVKLQAQEQAELDASEKPLPPVEVSVPSGDAEKAKKGSLPSWVKAVSATEEQVMKYQSNGKLYGHDPVKGIAYIIASLLIACMVFVAPAMAAPTDKATLGGIYSGDTYDCAIDSTGDLVCQSDVTVGGNLVVTGTTTQTGTLSATTLSATTLSASSVIATQYLRMQYVASASLRPASGAPAGSLIAIGNGATEQDCGATAEGTNYVVCTSNGTNWVVL